MAKVGDQLTGPRGDTLELTGWLGSGAFGEVFKAVAVRSGKMFAVKVLRSTGNPDYLKAIKNEASLAIQITHPNVVPVLHFELAPEPYLVTELVTGGTLLDLLDAHRQRPAQIELPKALRIVQAIADGMAAVNEKLVHRDLKPDNILMEGETPRVTDFGVAKPAGATRPPAETFKGMQPIAYLAPEGWRDGEHSSAMDVYSAGIVFAEVLTLKHPLEQFVTDPQSASDWRDAHLRAVVPDLVSFRKDLPPRLARLIAWMLEKDPANRPSWETVRARLGEIAEGKAPALPAALEGALRVAREHHQAEATRAAERTRERQEADHLATLYEKHQNKLRSSVDELIEAFNAASPVKLKRNDARGSTRTFYELPTDCRIDLRIFARGPGDLTAGGGRVCGAAYLGLDLHGGQQHAEGFNLILVGDSLEDPSARWVVVSGRSTGFFRGQTEEIKKRCGLTVEPFGLPIEEHFWPRFGEWVRGGQTVLTFTVDELDLETAIGQLIERGLARKG